jgi:hypothetical protein
LCNDAISNILQESTTSRPQPHPIGEIDPQIEYALSQISLTLGAKYRQAKRDIRDDSRESWSGIAHDIREMLVQVLRALAPNEAVVSCPWFKEEKPGADPTHKQRARYILESRRQGSKVKESTDETLRTLDDAISSLVRATYSRSSDAAHRSKEHRETKQIMRLFEILAHDLLETDGVPTFRE